MKKDYDKLFYNYDEKLYGSNSELDKIVDSKDPNIRKEAAKRAYGLDKLIYDEDWQVRKEVAYKGYHLNVLINDPHYEVRLAIVKQGFLNSEDYEKLINDSHYIIRETIANNGYCLYKLIDDEVPNVRIAVAKQGYGLDKLIDDEDSNVREAVQSYLKEHNYESIFNWIESNPNKVITNPDIDEWLNSNNKYKRQEAIKYKN